MKRCASTAPDALAAKEARQRANENLLKSFTCPLTQSLYIRPVLMADGFTYEEKGARAFLHSVPSSKYPGNSPLTTERLKHDNLEPNLSMRQALAHAVEAGHLAGELVEEYKKNMEVMAQDEAKLAELKAGVDRDDCDALTEMGIALRYGKYSQHIQTECAVGNFKRATELGSTTAMAHYGSMLLGGIGTTQRPSMGAAYIGMAAGQGSEYGCALLAINYSAGQFDFPKSQHQAARWCKMMGSCAFKDAPEELRAQCAAIAREEASREQRESEEPGSDDELAYAPVTPSYSPTHDATSPPSNVPEMQL